MIILWQFESCPYCIKVRKALMNKHIDFISIDASSPERKEFLQQIGGKAQVPFLLDTKNNKALYESDDIVRYIQSL
jgi:glutathione S-transferase